MKNSLFLAVTLFMCLTATAQNDNVFNTMVGDYHVYMLSEGQTQNDPSILIGATDDILAKYIPTGKYLSAVNTWVIKDNNTTILVDTGFGRNLFDNLASIGLCADDIDIVLLTHMHGDHIGGLLTNGEPSFPNAYIELSIAEHDYWTSDEAMNALPENRRGNFLTAREVFEKYKGKVRKTSPYRIQDVTDPGIHPVAAYGHTPGHIGVMINSLGERFFIWGDLTHVTPVQMPHPELAVTYDVDPAMAVTSRLEIMKYVADNKIRIGGMHIAYPATGYLTAAGDGYSFSYTGRE